ncbi:MULTISPECIES: hypothetical protein [unclassified Micromonospora]|uniref:hypothetical protein n=1 Tax=unclassified Micromonospora TaxID=2617518 RepID=UPI0022B6E966|nr:MULTISPECIES: hypothetical protein [unclassified Micromonospora]MCZ7419070.1 hypothetical protein [Verrucosispora sp. WMMA2121]WBB92737.1 hypothetical protein O7597_07045 [Verrucosispora sp. WMMC514]
MIALGLAVGSVAAPWSEMTLRVLGSTRGNSLVQQESTTGLAVTEIDGWGWAYLLVLVPLMLLAIASAVLPGYAGRAAAVAAGAALLAMSTVLVGAAYHLSSGPDEGAARWAEVVRRLVPVLEPDYGSIWFGYGTPGLACAVLAVATLAAVVLTSWWPGSGRVVVASAGTIALLAGIALPWVTVYGATASELDRRNAWWPTFGAPSVLVVVGTVALAALTWWMALRRSTRGRLPLVLVGVPAAFALFLVHDYLGVDPEDWQDAAERARYLAVIHDVRSAAELAQMAPALFLVAMVLAWSAARRRARAARSPAVAVPAETRPAHGPG